MCCENVKDSLLRVSYQTPGSRAGAQAGRAHEPTSAQGTPVIDSTLMCAANQQGRHAGVTQAQRTRQEDARDGAHAHVYW